jgi:prevent-host-death family protein
MTRCSHHEAMKEVGIAELKSHLSQYLRAVRSGQCIAVLDRDTPVAHIVPVRTSAKLRIRKPATGVPPLNRVPLPKPLRTKVDVVELLLEERQRHR